MIIIQKSNGDRVREMPSLGRDVLEFIVFACLFEYDDCE